MSLWGASPNLSLRARRSRAWQSLSKTFLLRTTLAFIVVFAFFLVSPHPTLAQDFSYNGHLKYQLSNTEYSSGDLNGTLGPNSLVAHEFDLRANGELVWNPFRFVAQAEALGLGGNAVEVAQSAVNINPFLGARTLLINDDRRLFDLTIEAIDEEDFVSVVRLDRLFASYSDEHLVVKLGRQAISWGNGLIFHVVDLFNPFSPIEIDKDYKTGDDMAYGQWLFDSGADIQGLAVVRRDPETDSVMSDERSYAMKFHQRISALELDVDLLAARHFDESVFAIGGSREFLGGILRGDVSLFELENNDLELFLVTNYDRSWVYFDKNFYGYIEYYRNAVGEGDGTYDQISDASLERVERGEAFVLGRDYLILGMRTEWMALFNTYINQIFNLHDESGIFQFRGEYDFKQNILIAFGVNAPYGSRGSEFGGVPIPGTNLFLGSEGEVYVRVSYFY